MHHNFHDNPSVTSRVITGAQTLTRRFNDFCTISNAGYKRIPVAAVLEFVATISFEIEQVQSAKLSAYVNVNRSMQTTDDVANHRSSARVNKFVTICIVPSEQTLQLFSLPRSAAVCDEPYQVSNS